MLGDLILADSGFTIQAEINVSAFTWGKSRLSLVDVEEARNIANEHVRVARIIGGVRQKNKVFQSTLHLITLHAVDRRERRAFFCRIFIVSSALVSLWPPTIPFG